MVYQENYQKWLAYAKLPDYLHQELLAMDEKTKEDAFILILSLVQRACVVILALELIGSIFTSFVKQLKGLPN